MGVLTYGGTDFVFSDRLLAHLQVVITTKLRRRESFALSWIPDEGGRGREAIWIDNGQTIRFVYDEATIPPLNREWLEVLIDGTHRPNGLLVSPEPTGAGAGAQGAAAKIAARP